MMGCGVTVNIEPSSKRRRKEMNRVTHFEIYTNDPQAVQPFYQDVFGWKFNKFEGGPIEYWLVTTGDDKEPGINGGVNPPREREKTRTLKNPTSQTLLPNKKKKKERRGKKKRKRGGEG